jgi:hypothetical protein
MVIGNPLTTPACVLKIKLNNLQLCCYIFIITFSASFVHVLAGRSVPVERWGVCPSHPFFWTQVGIVSAQEYENFGAVTRVHTPYQQYHAYC